MRVCVKFFVVLVFLTFFGAASAFAKDPLTKLGRGITNVLTGWFELPKNMYATSVEQNPFVGLSGGLIHGTGLALRRTAAGLLEMVTFPIPSPAQYESVIEPEYVF